VARSSIQSRRDRRSSYLRNDRTLCPLRDDGKPALVFAAHLANWELPALAAMPSASTRSRSTAARDPQIRDFVLRTRSRAMGSAGADQSRARRRVIADELARGTHAGMLVDQLTSAASSDFLRPAHQANPLIARLARQSIARSTACAWCGCRATVSASS
jgi:KDO2-lipid IV(A) lauroyltransferase